MTRMSDSADGSRVMTGASSRGSGAMKILVDHLGSYVFDCSETELMRTRGTAPESGPSEVTCLGVITRNGSDLYLKQYNE